MPKGKAFIVVGHRHWGKSSTLKALTNGNVHKDSIEIGGRIFFIRRMSNDDDSEGLVEFVKGIKPKIDLLIMTLCPAFNKPERMTNEVLELLHQRFELFFWVILNKCKGRPDNITDSEIAELRRHGKVEVFDGKGPPPVLADTLSIFIRANME